MTAKTVNIIQIMVYLREFDLSMNQALVLIMVGQSDAPTVSSIAKLTGLNNPTTSRVLASLSDMPEESARRKGGGLGFIRLIDSYEDRRCKYVQLTDKGHIVMKHLKELL